MNRPLRPFLSLVFALILLLCLLLPAPALALDPGDEFTAVDAAGQGIRYRVSTPGELEVIAVSFGGYTGDIVIPDTVSAGGQPYSVTGIGDSAFSYCTGLTSVTIPNSVKSIGDSAFSYCTGLTSVSIPGSVQSIGVLAFYGCTGLTSVTLQDGVESIGTNAFRDCTGLQSVTIPGSVKSIGENAFYGCTGLTSVTLQDGVGSIGESAFTGCTGLTGVTIPASVTAWGSYAFYGCTGLTSVTLQDGVESIGESAFRACRGLQSVTIPGSVESIGESAFRDCTGLRSVAIPASVQNIGVYAFWGCTGLTSVTFLGAAPPAFLSTTGLDGTIHLNEAFFGCGAGLVFYVPAGSEEAYRAALIKTGLADPIVKAIPAAGADYTHGLYPMLSGDGAAWPGAGTLNFTSAGPFSGFQWASVDGAVLPASAYTVTEGSTVLALQPAYLATLSAGTHKLTMQFSGGYSEASFTTGAALIGPPKTGEQAQPWAVLALGVLALAGVCLSRRKVK